MAQQRCEHENFNAYVDVHKISQTEGGPTVVYSVETKISCRECGQPLEFVGVPNGMSFYRPTVSIDGRELRTPMVIPGQTVPQGMAGFSVSHEVFEEKAALKQ
jgi:hypothetical protein